MSLTNSPKGLIHIAREMHKEADAIASTVKDIQFVAIDGDLAKKFEHVAELRVELLKSKPASAIDRLMIFGAIRSVAMYLATAIDGLEENAVEPFPQINSGLREILLGLSQLQGDLEKESGSTLAELNLFSNANTLQ